ncbi:MAG: GNAT family N-acetyltransferase [Cyanobacteriota bacterium]
MTTLTRRPYAGETDLEAIANLINTCEAVDRMDNGTSVPELRRSLDDPSVDTVRGICLWEDADGQLVGFSRLWIAPTGEIIDGFLGFRVHPTVRGGNLEMQIVAWAQGRLREVGQERGLQVKLRSGTRADQTDRIALLEKHGFIADRYFFTMELSLSDPIPEPQFPQGFTLYQGNEQDAEAKVELYNQAFIDHWNHHPLTVERIKQELNKPYYRPELDLIAVAPDGTFAAFCYCEINPEENIRNGRNEGWIACLGTRRGFRKRGLGRAMLLAGIQQLKEASVNAVRLGVDTQNPSGALRLYESVGFRQVYTHRSFVKEV